MPKESNAQRLAALFDAIGELSAHVDAKLWVFAYIIVSNKGSILTYICNLHRMQLEKRDCCEEATEIARPFRKTNLSPAAVEANTRRNAYDCMIP